MKGASPIAVSIVAATLALLAAPAAGAEEPTRDQYRALVEPICEQNTLANERILKGAQRKANSDRMREAGGQFIRASEKFAATVDEIAAVPRPPADDARLVKWFGFLDIVAKNLRNVGKALKEEDRIKAVHERIRVERSSNAANNVGFVFQFHYCRITPSRFT